MPQAQTQTLRVVGYTQLMSAFNAMPNEIKKDVREALRTSGERVQRDSASKTADRLTSPRSAHGYRTYVRARGVSVEQSLRKTTGLRPDWGTSQMRESLVPSLIENEPNTVQDFEKAVAEINDYFALRSRWVARGFLPA